MGFWDLIMAKKCSYCGEMTTKPHYHKKYEFPKLKDVMLNYDEFFSTKKQQTKKRGKK